MHTVLCRRVPLFTAQHQEVETACVFIHGQADKHVQSMEYYSALKMSKILTLATTWTNLEVITLR